MPDSTQVNAGQATSTQSNLPNLSDVVQEQIKEVLSQIQTLGKKGYRVTHLLESLGNKASVLKNTDKLSILEIIDIENEVSLTKRRVEYSIGKGPIYHVLYQLIWIAVWIFGVIPHRFLLYKYFSAGDTIHTAIIGAIAGSIGASLFALGGLYKHRIHLDLDEKFSMWYCLKPIVGSLMGSFVGLMAVILVAGLGGTSSSPAVIILSAFGGMHEAWGMSLFKKYTDKALGSNAPTSGTKAGA